VSQEVELKWRVRTFDRVLMGMWQLVVGRPLLTRLRRSIPHLSGMSANDLRAKFGPNIVGRHPWVFERNIKYDTPSGKDGRLRMVVSHYGVHGAADRIFELTLKQFVPHPDFQIQDEVSIPLVGVSGNGIQHWLRSCGWKQRWVYENRRTDIRISGVVVSLRSFPAFGLWVEIEGLPDDILRVARAFGLRPNRAVREGWHSIWQEFCRTHRGYDPDNLTFSAIKFAKKEKKNG